MRYRKKKWADKEIAENTAFIEEPQMLKGSWQKAFNNTAPIYIEIGCGKGGFISKMAALYPHINFIGIEREKQIIVTALKKVREAQISNVRFCLWDAEKLNDIFDTGETRRIYINFCDPWHRKKKWAKRRLTHRNFLERYESLFGEKGGEVFLKTDNMILFEFSLNEFSDKLWRLHNISLDLHNSDFKDNVMTEYEEKFSGLGQPIYRLEAYYKTTPEGEDEGL
ncbi:MAG: tRNA (guanosine(46)-N7)-methyltransferase TrmB [Firmicutes bacterium]|nr:tRNA (guanosine(46)-N7)-methyltransferase TrmB [Bacillota bacterium]